MEKRVMLACVKVDGISGVREWTYDPSHIVAITITTPDREPWCEVHFAGGLILYTRDSRVMVNWSKP